MSWNLTVGPPGSGRTTAMVAVARAACQADQRVWYVGLPAQRAYITRRITADDFTALGLEVMSAQQMYYRLLTGGGNVDVKPLVVGNGRLVRVAEALMTVTGALPSPGEARLFAAAIAEAKRFDVSIDELATTGADDVERGRLVDVFRAYQHALQGAWDYDDVRLAAVAMVESATHDPAAQRALEAVPADVIIVDGLREIGPLELRVLKALARWRDVYLTLPAAPAGEEPTETLTVTHPATVERYLAPNPVAEARWVMSSLKRDLAQAGADPLDLAVIAPPGTAAAVVALADEYGVPIMDETPVALADSAAGRTLLDLLELSDAPTASRLLGIPDLAPVTAAALAGGVSGSEAMHLIAGQLGLSRQLRTWLDRLTVTGDPVDWARYVVTEVLTLTQPRLPEGFEDRVLTMAQEAARLGTGEGFRRWWVALLSAARHGRRQPGGVALVDATLVSGRRFEKIYVMSAVEGAYGAREREDYFTPEELRFDAEVDGAVGGLPVRLQGRDAEVVEELVTRAPHVTITAATADRTGLLTPDLSLLQGSRRELPAIPAGSRLELPEAAPYQQSYDSVDLGEPTVEYLREYSQCALKAWGRRHLTSAGPREAGDVPEWLVLRRALLSEPRLTGSRLDQLMRDFPEAADWLERHREQLQRLNYRQPFKDEPSQMVALVDAGERAPLRGARAAPGAAAADDPRTQKIVIYRFAEPVPDADWDWASQYMRNRWTEYLAAAVSLRHRTKAPAFVEFVVWPVYGDPVPVGISKNEFVRTTIEECSAEVKAAAERFASGYVTPTPGFVCRDCEFSQVCRVREQA